MIARMKIIAHILYAHACTMAFKKKEKTNKQTDRQLKHLSHLRAPPVVHFHRIVHSFKKGRFLIETISF